MIMLKLAWKQNVNVHVGHRGRLLMYKRIGKIHINRYPAQLTTYRIMWCGKREENMKDARVTNLVSKGTCGPCRKRYMKLGN